MDNMQEDDAFVSSMPSVEVYTDGGFRTKIGTGGYGAVAYCGPYHQFFYGGFHDVSNNQMEIQAVLAVLRSLNCRCRVHIVSDSQYVVNSINGWVMGWRNNGWMTRQGAPVANREMWEEMWGYMQYHLITAEWKRGHSEGNTLNTMCDHLAAIGMYKEAHLAIPRAVLDPRRK